MWALCCNLDLQDGSNLDYLSFEATFVFLTFLYYAVILVKNTGVLMLLSGVVKDGEDDHDLQDGSYLDYLSF